MIRHIFTIFFVYATAMAIAKLFTLDLFEWTNLLRYTSFPYEISVNRPFQFIASRFASIGIPIPDWTRDVFIVWIALGRIMRKVISDLESEAINRHYEYNSDTPAPRWRERVSTFFKEPRKTVNGWWSAPATKEKFYWTVFPFGRLWTDLKGGYVTGKLNGEPFKKRNISMYWGLSPKRTIQYLGLSIISLAVILVLDAFF